jgi:hypothetical protein
MQRPPSFAGEWRHGWRTEEPGGRDGRKKANYQGLTPTFPFSGSSEAGRPGDRPRTSR